MREELWNGLQQLKPSISGPWAVMGDFNSILSNHEVLGGAQHHRSCNSFQQCIEDYELIDAGFHGLLFTWRRGSLKERLDRLLVSREWLLSFQDVGVVHLPMFGSDHSPLWIKSGYCLHVTQRPKPFKFIEAWLGHQNFESLVKDSWKSEVSWVENVNSFVGGATGWNKHIFGHIQRKKQHLINRLHGIHNSL